METQNDIRLATITINEPLLFSRFADMVLDRCAKLEFIGDADGLRIQQVITTGDPSVSFLQMPFYERHTDEDFDIVVKSIDLRSAISCREGKTKPIKIELSTDRIKIDKEAFSWEIKAEESEPKHNVRSLEEMERPNTVRLRAEDLDDILYELSVFEYIYFRMDAVQSIMTISSSDVTEEREKRVTRSIPTEDDLAVSKIEASTRLVFCVKYLMPLRKIAPIMPTMWINLSFPIHGPMMVRCYCKGYNYVLVIAPCSLTD